MVSALIMSGLPTDKFSFYGFIPRKTNDKEKFIQNLRNENKTSIFFESSKRAEKTLSNLAKYLDPRRKISVCKEMTKLHENVIRGDISNILSIISEQNILLKGEIVIVVEGSKKEKIDLQFNNKIKKEFLTKLSASEAAKLISIISGQNKREIYKKLIEK